MPNDTILLQPGVQEDLDIGVGTVEVAAPSGGYALGHKINLGSFAIKQNFTVSPGTIASQGVYITQIAVPGAALGYLVLVGVNTVLVQAAQISARIQTTDSVNFAIFNRSPSLPITISTLSGALWVFPVDVT